MFRKPPPLEISIYLRLILALGSSPSRLRATAVPRPIQAPSCSSVCTPAGATTITKRRSPSGTTSVIAFAEFTSAGGGTLTGSVDPNGVATSYRFEYGTTAAYGLQSAGGDVPEPLYQSLDDGQKRRFGLLLRVGGRSGSWHWQRRADSGR